MSARIWASYNPALAKKEAIPTVMAGLAIFRFDYVAGGDVLGDAGPPELEAGRIDQEVGDGGHQQDGHDDQQDQQNLQPTVR